MTLGEVAGGQPEEKYGEPLIERLDSESFARRFSERSRQLAWFLGSGTSASAGIPTGWDMITDFKTRLYCAGTRTPRREVDPTGPIWQERVGSYFDGAHGLPPAGDPDEYAEAFEAVFPDPRDRRSYIESAIRRGSASFGHRVLASLITAGEVRCVFTTNFDPLVERTTVASDDLMPPERRCHLTVGALDSVERVVRCIRDDEWPLLVKLHGDYQSERLKNTTVELQEQDGRLRAALIEVLGRFGLIVVGYSGRDHSVMDALDEAVMQPGAMPAGLYWSARPGDVLLPRVNELLERADARGIDTCIVASENFDELAGDLEREIDMDSPLRTFVSELRSRPPVEPAPLPSIQAQRFPVLRCSALELLEIPTEAVEISLDRAVTSVEARRLVKEAGVRATVASRGEKVVAFGSEEDLVQAFAQVRGRISGRTPIDPGGSSVDLGLVYDAFTRALTGRRPLRPMLRHRGHQVLVQPPDVKRGDAGAVEARQRLQALKDAYAQDLTGNVKRIGRPFAEGLGIRLERWSGTWWCVYEPFTWVDLNDAPEAERDAAADWRRERWAQRYNPRWHDIIAAWAKLLAPEPDTGLLAHQTDGAGVGAAFRLSWTTAWSSPGRRIDVTVDD